MFSERVVDPNLSSGYQASQWLAVRLVARWTTSLHLSPMIRFVFRFYILAFRAEANLSHSAGGLVASAALQIQHQLSWVYIQRSIVHSFLIVLIVLFDRKL